MPALLSDLDTGSPFPDPTLIHCLTGLLGGPAKDLSHGLASRFRPTFSSTAVQTVLTLIAFAVLAVIVWATSPYWRPVMLNTFGGPGSIGPSVPGEMSSQDDHAGHDHAGHSHGSSVENSITLSPQSRRNINLTTRKVALEDFTRTITVPGIIVERPGRTHVEVSAPVTGVILDAYAEPGESVHPGDPLFVLRLTHEEVVQAQTEFLKALEAIDVENREIERLESIRSGVIAEKVVIERKYERQKLEGLLKALRQALLLHGLSEEQVENIARDRRLLQEFLIRAPEVHDETDEGHLTTAHPRLGDAAAPAVETGEQKDQPRLIVQNLPVHKGRAVSAGQTLITMVNLESVFIEGHAFEQDAPEVLEVARNDRNVTALPTGAGANTPISGLEITYVDTVVDPDSRTLRFFVELPNQPVLSPQPGEGSFVTWRFRPGQRMEIRLPVEQWEDKIVLPPTAIAEEGASSYVFVQNGRTFERKEVHVEYRGRDAVVIANDGSLFPGETVVTNGAHQLLMALKSQAGGGVDPHAGHMH